MDYRLTLNADQLDKKRLEALMKIRDRMTSEIEMHRRAFFHAVEDSSIKDAMGSSFAFGYLRLKSDRCLNSQNPGRDVNVPDFLGVNFDDVKESVLSMQELDNWVVCKVPPAAYRIVPGILAATATIPFVGAIPLVGAIPIFSVANYIEQFQMQLGGDFKNELVMLIEQLEREVLGIDLDYTDVKDQYET